MAGVIPPSALVTGVMNGTAAAPAGVPQPPQPPPATPSAVNGTAAPSPVSKAPSEVPLPVSKDSKANVVDKPVDEESKKGRFGWFDIEKVSLYTFARVSIVLYYLILERTKRGKDKILPILSSLNISSFNNE